MMVALRSLGMGMGMIAGGCLALAGCGSKTVTADNASVEEVAKKVQASGIVQDSFIEAGHWQTTMTIQDMRIPGMPPEMAGRMQAAMGKGKTFDSCVTPEEAKKPKEDFFAGSKAANCKYEHFTMGGGVINMALVCHGIEGATQHMTMNGTYAPGAYRMAIDSRMEGAGGGPMKGMTMKAVMEGKRTGECTGKEKE